jgi:hypothetical protein
VGHIYRDGLVRLIFSKLGMILTLYHMSGCISLLMCHLIACPVC